MDERDARHEGDNTIHITWHDQALKDPKIFCFGSTVYVTLAQGFPVPHTGKIISWVSRVWVETAILPALLPSRVGISSGHS